MKAGNFNINDYLDKLYEESTPMMTGGEGLTDAEGIIIPDGNKKSYDWLKREYQKGQTEVKVEISMGGAKFEPGYDLQTDLKSVKDFKPGMFGEVKTAENPNPKKPASLDGKKEQGSFAGDEGNAQKKELPKKEGKPGEAKVGEPKTNAPKDDIKNKEHQEHEEGESEEKEKKEEHEASETPGEEKKEEEKDKPEVKKIDLKTKKK
jgi:hypothetical protein